MAADLATRDSYVPAEPGLLDEVERRLVLQAGAWERKPGQHSMPDFPVRHTFTPGLYVREITMPAGAILTSKIHLTEHPFVVSKGRCRVFNDATGEWQELAAPFQGVTQPGSRRLLVILEETVWTTFHATEATDPDEVEKEILADYRNPLLAELEEVEEPSLLTFHEGGEA